MSSRNITTVTIHHGMLVKRVEREIAESALGAFVGAVMGAVAGPVGVAVGAVFGGAVGLLAGVVGEREDDRASQRTAMLDNEIGVRPCRVIE
jgi:phage tail tape-measure protein